ncbi:angiopoietin-4-like [Mytilus trossulus]|uniref:angiopoietin-4-like n=1 Tax=Mytilus trossulus TaxID=6551 RepID=UPI003007C246
MSAWKSTRNCSKAEEGYTSSSQNMAIYKYVVKMNKQLKNNIKWILEEIRGGKEILRIVSLLKNDFKGTCAKPARDCTELKKYNKQSGVYKISAGNSKALKVYCDMTTDGGGWSIIQRHQDGNVDFQRTWPEYENGFGNLEGDYWLECQILPKSLAQQESRCGVVPPI